MSATAAMLTPVPVQDSAVRIALDFISLALLMTGAFCCPMSWYVAQGYLSVSDACFLLALASQTPWALQRLAQTGGVPWLIVLAGVLFGLSGMIVYALDEPYAEPVNAAKLAFSLTLFPLLLVVTVSERPWLLDAVLAAWVAGAAFSALVAIASRNQIALFGLMDEVAAAGYRARGLTYHANVLGYSCALAAPTAIYLAKRYAHWSARLTTVTALGILLAGLYLCGSRSAVFALALGLLVPGIGQIKLRHLPIHLTALLGLLSATVIGFMIAGELDLRITEGLRESVIGRILGLSESAGRANTERRLYIDMAWAAFQEHPFFGNGYGWLRGAHIHVLSVLHCGGLLGLAALMSWMAGVLAACVSVRNGAQGLVSAQDYGLWLLAIAGIIIWFVSGVLQPLLSDRNGYILIGVLLVLDARRRSRRYFPNAAAAGA